MEKLYNKLHEQGLYTKSLEDFKVQFNNEESVNKLYNNLHSSGQYTKSQDDFKQQFGFQMGKPQGAQNAVVTAAPVQKQADTTKYTTQLENGFKGSPEEDPMEATRKAREYELNNQTWIERTFERNYFTEFAGDMYRAAAGGFTAGDVSDEALDLLSGFTGEEDIEEWMEAHEASSKYQQSDEMAEFNRIADEEGVWAFVKKAITEKQSLLKVGPEIMIQSVAQMLGSESALATGGAVVGTGAAIGAAGGLGVMSAGTAGAGAIASIPTAYAAAGATLEAGMSFSGYIDEELQERGLELNKENVKALLEDDDFVTAARAKAASRGVIIGAVDRMTAGLGAKVGAKLGYKTLKNVGAQVVIESAGGGGGEAIAQLATEGEIEVKDVFLETLGETPGAGINIAKATLQAALPGEYKIEGQTVGKEEINSAVDKFEDADFAKTNFDIKNNPALKEKVEKRKSDLKSRIDDFNDTKEAIQENINAKNEADKQEIKSIKEKIAETEKSDPTSDKIEELKSKITSLKDSQKKRQDSFSENEDLIKGIETGILSGKLNKSINFAKKFSAAFGIEVDDTLTVDQIKKQYGKEKAGALGFIEGKKIIINKAVALEARAVDVGSHELLHGVLSSAFKDKDLATQVDLKDKFLEKLSAADKKKVLNRIESADYSSEYLYANPDEYLTQASDLIQEGQITYNESVFTKVGDLVTPILRSFGFRKIKFNTGEDVYDFMREYSKSIKTGELNKAIIVAAGGEVKNIKFKASKQLGSSIKALVPEGTSKAEYDKKVIGAVYTDLIAGSKLHPLINNNLSKFGIPKEQVSAEFYEDVKNKLFERSLQRFNPEKNDDLGGFVVNELQRFSIPDIVNEYKSQGRFQTTEQIDAAPAEGRVLPMQVAEEVTTEDIIERAEEQDAIVEERTFRENLGIEKGGSVYTSVINSVTRTLGTKLPSVTDPKFRRAVIDEFKRDLMKPMKDFVGKKAKYREFVFNNIDTITSKIPTRELVKLEQQESNKIFADLVVARASTAEVDDAVSKGLYLLPGASRVSGTSIYRKLDTTPDQLWKFLTGNAANVNGARKTALVERLVQELAFDASMQVLRDTDALGKMREIASLSELEVVTNDLAEIGKQLERDPATTKFSLSVAQTNEINENIDRFASAIIEEKFNYNAAIRLVFGGGFFNDLEEKAFVRYLKTNIEKHDRAGRVEEIKEQIKIAAASNFNVFQKLLSLVDIKRKKTGENGLNEIFAYGPNPNKYNKAFIKMLEDHATALKAKFSDNEAEALREFINTWARTISHGPQLSTFNGNQDILERFIKGNFSANVTDYVELVASGKGVTMYFSDTFTTDKPQKITEVVQSQSVAKTLVDDVKLLLSDEKTISKKLQIRDEKADLDKKRFKDLVEFLKERYNNSENKETEKVVLLMTALQLRADMKALAKVFSKVESIVIPVETEINDIDFKSTKWVYEHKYPTTSLLVDVLDYIVYDNKEGYENGLGKYAVSIVTKEFNDALEAGNMNYSEIDGKRYTRIIDPGKYKEYFFSTKTERKLSKKVETTPSADANSAQFSKKHRAQYEKSLVKRRKDLTKKQVENQVDNIFNWLNTTDIPDQKKKKFEELALFYMYQPGFILPEDGYKLIDAERIASIKGIDPRTYDNPSKLINDLGETVKKAYINPDSSDILSNKRELSDGITLYDVENTEKGQDELANVVQSHLGKNWNNWCIVAKDKTGKTNRSIWDTYGNVKVAAMKDGKILSLGVGYMPQLMPGPQKNIVLIKRFDSDYSPNDEDYQFSAFYNMDTDKLYIEGEQSNELIEDTKNLFDDSSETFENLLQQGRNFDPSKPENKENLALTWWDKNDDPNNGILLESKNKNGKISELLNPITGKKNIIAKEVKSISKDSNGNKTESLVRYRDNFERGGEIFKQSSTTLTTDAETKNTTRNQKIYRSSLENDGTVTTRLTHDRTTIYDKVVKFDEELIAVGTSNPNSNTISYNNIIYRIDGSAMIESLAKLGDATIVRTTFTKKQPKGTSVMHDFQVMERPKREKPFVANSIVTTITSFPTDDKDFSTVYNENGILYREKNGKVFITELDKLHNAYLASTDLKTRKTLVEAGDPMALGPSTRNFFIDPDSGDMVALAPEFLDDFNESIILGLTPDKKDSSKSAEIDIEAKKEELFDKRIPVTSAKFSKKAKDSTNTEKDAKAKETLDQQFNNIIEDKTGIKATDKYTKAQAAAAAQRKKYRSFFIPPAAEDFLGLLYSFLSPGKKGNEQLKFFKDNLITPMNTAFNNWAQAKYVVARDFRVLRKKHKGVRKKLNEFVPNTNFTIDQAIRIYLYDKAGHKIPGISEAELKAANSFVAENLDIYVFANELRAITRIPEGFKKPSEEWIAATLTSEMYEISQNVVRKQFFEPVIENLNTVFNEDNLNKIEAFYGKNFREALEDSIYRIRTGSNRNFGSKAKYLNQFNDWLNGSVGTIMFLNSRSAVLQTISAINYVNWSDNNMAKAGAAFANQPQFWSDFAYLFNSAYLKERRSGLQSDLNLAELQAAVAGSKNKARAGIKYLLEKGFMFTQAADSFAIASGGATFYRNRVATYTKQGLSQKEAEAKAFNDFQNITETNQQSSRPDKISQQQAGPLGRVILAFANTPAQYAREIKKASLDLINGRGDVKTNISKIVYYGAMQNLIFNTLQTALFAMLFDDEDDEDKEKFIDQKEARVINGMVDSILRGTGIAGSVAATVKNVLLEFVEQDAKGYRADNASIIVEALNVSPPIGSKARRVKSALDSYKYNKELIEEYGYSIDNPLVGASANIISAATNIPLDRLVRKVDNISAALDSDNEVWQRIATAGGWSKWDVGIKDKEREKIKEIVKANKKEAKKPQGNEPVETYQRKVTNRKVTERKITKR